MVRATKALLIRKGKGILAPVLDLYLRIAPSFEKCWLEDALDAYLAVHDKSLGQALIEIQDAGHSLPAQVVAQLLDNEELTPRPSAADKALIRTMTDQVGSARATSQNVSFLAIHGVEKEHF